MDTQQGSETNQGSEKQGSLMVVGSGIKGIAQITPEAQGWIEQAGHVLYFVVNPATEIWIKQKRANKPSTDLSTLYKHDTPFKDIYKDMAKLIMDEVVKGQDVCAVFYGHPGVLVRTSREAIFSARKQGYRAAMLPGISALDCLIADLVSSPDDLVRNPPESKDIPIADLMEEDLVARGCQMFTARDFLRRPVDSLKNTDCHLVLWQIAAVGETRYNSSGPSGQALGLLVEKLRQVYGERDFPVVLYNAAKYPTCLPLILHLPLSQLESKLKQGPAMVTASSTLYVPPKHRSPEVDSEEADKPLGTPDANRYIASRTGSPLADLLGGLSRNPRLLAAFNRARTSIANMLGELSRNPGLRGYFIRDAASSPQVRSEWANAASSPQDQSEWTEEELKALSSESKRALDVRLAMLGSQHTTAGGAGGTYVEGASVQGDSPSTPSTQLNKGELRDAISSPTYSEDLAKVDDGSVMNWIA